LKVKRSWKNTRIRATPSRIAVFQSRETEKRRPNGKKKRTARKKGSIRLKVTPSRITIYTIRHRGKGEEKRRKEKEKWKNRRIF